ncbi:MAG: VTT domain-containing protein [Chloroflexota bacterium]|nr:VTT domain-containing protein [Chloroflexota bacterium]
MENGENETVVEGGEAEASVPSNQQANVVATGEETAQVPRKRRWTKQHWVSLFIVLGIAVVFIIVYILSKALDDAWLYGYFGVFVVSLMASATLIIPIPGFAVVFVMGAVLNPWLVGLMVGLAEPFGELTGYMAGYSGKVALQNRRFYPRLERWMKRRGPVVLFGFSALPNPFTDVAGVAAGAIRYPIWKFLLVMFIGKTVKGWIVAFAGYWTLRLVVQMLVG